MKTLLTIILFLSFAFNTFSQSDSGVDKKSVAIIELGGGTGWNIREGGLSYSPTIAVEVTPIENWLELESGVTPTFGNHSTEWDIDLLFKKPWTLSPKIEFMFGVGAAWIHMNANRETINSVDGEIALDFMFWPFTKQRFGLYLEPGYEYNFRQGHEQSVGINGGLLIAIP